MFIFRLAFLSFLLLFCVGVCSADDSDYVTINLINAGYNSSLGYVLMGVEFVMKDGWHIYWKEPGDMGLATRFDFKDLSGIKSYDVHWPVYEHDITKFHNEKFVSNVYKDRVVFPVRFIPEDLGKSFVTQLSVNYAVCGEICIPGNKNIDISYDPSFTTKLRTNKKVFHELLAWYAK